MKIKISKILCPIDFSDNSDHAARYAVAMAQAYGAELQLLHVIAPPVAALPGDQLIPDLVQTNIEEIENASRERLERILGDFADLGVTVQSRVIGGIPFLEIIRVAREEEIDLIVMGTHGRTGLEHLLIGSVAERVVRKAPCPVLTVKHPQHEFVMP